MKKKYTSPFMNALQDRFVVQHKSYKTEQAYLPWIERFIRFHKMQHPSTRRRHPKNTKTNGSQGREDNDGIYPSVDCRYRRSVAC